MIKQTQDQWLERKSTDSCKNEDIHFPYFEKLILLLGFKYLKIKKPYYNFKELKRFLKNHNPKFVEINVNSNARVVTQVKFGRPNENMEPFLDDDLLITF